MLAAKSALGLRVDALSTWGVSSEDSSKEPTEEEKSQLGRDARLAIERRLRALEGKPLKSLANANQTALGGQKKWEVKEARKYNPDADGLTGDEPAADAPKSKSAKTNGTPKKLVQEVDSDGDQSMADADGASGSDSESEEKPAGKGDKASKKAEKEAKKARKAERAAKREAKAAKKAAKEAKKAEKESKDSKKRKADDGEDKAEKKKKKKSKD
jgi:nucleolar protein 58